jgi:hypothetical protein
MTLTINISPEKGAAYQALAQAQGLSVEQWLTQLVDRAAPVAPLETSGAADDDRPIWEIFVDSMKDVPPEDLATLPKDGASQHDHYIYGWPKREE